MKRSGWIQRKTPIRRKSSSPSALMKDRIQELLRGIVILRDGGCILRHYGETGQCGGYRNDGELILQAEHLHTRANAASFADTRLVVCLCKRHHIFWKKQFPDQYYRIVKTHIGPERTKLLEAVQNDYSTHKVDLALEIVALQQELKELST